MNPPNKTQTPDIQDTPLVLTPELARARETAIKHEGYSYRVFIDRILEALSKANLTEEKLISILESKSLAGILYHYNYGGTQYGDVFISDMNESFYESIAPETKNLLIKEAIREYLVRQGASASPYSLNQIYEEFTLDGLPDNSKTKVTQMSTMSKDRKGTQGLKAQTLDEGVPRVFTDQELFADIVVHVMLKSFPVGTIDYKAKEQFSANFHNIQFNEEGIPYRNGHRSNDIKLIHEKLEKFLGEKKISTYQELKEEIPKIANEARKKIEATMREKQTLEEKLATQTSDTEKRTQRLTQEVARVRQDFERVTQENQTLQQKIAELEAKLQAATAIADEPKTGLFKKDDRVERIAGILKKDN
ncbi:hypothetical protein CVV38_01615 [Candidatus Peregrinibacteria bacterium HGW-Peregrinibacteria-1]|jgi:hypothetical protein|nr:MAG: hypothetical protein CVV38_01615 [Candidatus Peregrinibacteria bacterium HGW-Peregrinibacteria-1]